MQSMVLGGAIPVYVNPDMDKNLGIALGMKFSQVEKTIRENYVEKLLRGVEIHE